MIHGMSGLSNEIGAARPKKEEVLISTKPKSGYKLLKDHSVVYFQYKIAVSTIKKCQVPPFQKQEVNGMAIVKSTW